MNFCVASARRRESGRGVLCGGSPARARWWAVTASGICRADCLEIGVDRMEHNEVLGLMNYGNEDPAQADGRIDERGLQTYDGSIFIHF